MRSVVNRNAVMRRIVVVARKKCNILSVSLCSTDVGKSRTHSVKNSFWMSLWNCRKKTTK